MGEYEDEGVRERTDCGECVFITPGGQRGLVVMISCWGGSLDSLSLFVQELFVSAILTCFHLSADGPCNTKATVRLHCRWAEEKL